MFLPINKAHSIYMFLCMVFVIALQCFCDVKSRIIKKGTVKMVNELPLKNEDYWDAPDSKLNDFTWDVLQAGEEIIIIDCPDFIPTRIKQKFPVVMVGARNVGVPYKHNFEGKTIGICTNLETGRSFIGSVHRAPDVTSNLVPSPGLIVQDYVINLRQFLGIPWEVATYKIWFVYYDLLSNGITCRLSADSESYNSEDEKRYLDKVVLGSSRRSILSDNAITYSKAPALPKPEPAIGISTRQGDDNEKILKIDGTLYVFSNHKVLPEEKIGTLDGVCAVIPLELLIIRTHGTREQRSLGVPCYGELQNKNGKELGTFLVEINLAQLNIAKLSEGEKMFIYAFSGEYATGPLVIE